MRTLGGWAALVAAGCMALAAGCATLSPKEQAAREAQKKREARAAYWHMLEMKARAERSYRAQNARPIPADPRARYVAPTVVSNGDGAWIGVPAWQIQSSGAGQSSVQQVWGPNGLNGTVQNGQIWLNNGTFGTINGNQVWLSTGRMGYVSGNTIYLR